MEGRSAAGQAAGYHFQIQRALLSLIAGDDATTVAIETLDDVVVEDATEAIRDFEQLKHSIHPGMMTDRTARSGRRSTPGWIFSTPASSRPSTR